MTRRGTNNVTLRLTEELWSAFGALTDDRSAVLREFIRWYTRQPGAKMPKRPEWTVVRSAGADHEGDSSP